jgi:plasmid stabilization system protein ParE
MPRQIIFEPEARLELQDTAAWYDAQRPGLGDRFVAEIHATSSRILRNPDRLPLAGTTMHRARLKVFDCSSIYFSIERNFIGIVSVFHGARNPAELRRRLR